MMWGYGGWPMMWGWGILMWLVPLGLVALLFWAISRPGRRRYHRFGGPHGWMDPDYVNAGDPALDIIRQRFAKGEISEEEYDRLKDKLGK